MAEIHNVKFYPVSNGDTVQIILENRKRILFDFHHCKASEDGATKHVNLAKELREELKAAKCDYFDMVAFTHADEDHIKGSTDFFWLEHAAKYQGDDRIKIKELWVPAAMLIEEGTNDDQLKEYVLLRQEARHRLLEGKGIRVFSKPPALMDWLEPALKTRGEEASARDHLFEDAGNLAQGFSLKADGVEFFTHSPFIKHCEGGDIVRNSASLVFNIRFKCGDKTFDFLQVGDSCWQDLEEIVNITRYHGNDDRLRWDLYNIPHHCSYKALSEEKGERETVPEPKIKELLLDGKDQAYIVSSSDPIPDKEESYDPDLKQPPHIQARNAYERHLRAVGGRRFLVTMEQPNQIKPRPMVFEFSIAGLQLQSSSQGGTSSILTAAAPRVGCSDD